LLDTWKDNKNPPKGVYGRKLQGKRVFGP